MPPLHDRGFSSRRTLQAAVLVGFVLTACTTLRVPTEVPTFKPEEVFRTSKSGITLEVRPIEGRDQYWEMFDDDLPQIGIVALWLRIHNATEGAVDLSGVDWELRAGKRTFSDLDAQRILKQFYKGRRIRMYNPHTDLKSRQKLEDLLLDRALLAPSGSRAGFVFLSMDPARAPNWSQGGTFVARGLRLANRKKVQLELLLSRQSGALRYPIVDK